MFLCLLKTCFVLLSHSPPPVLLFFFVLLLPLLCSAFNITLRMTSTASCNIFGYLFFLIHYLMEKSCASSPYFLLSGLLIKTIVDHDSNVFFFILIILSASYTSSSFLNSLVVLIKLSKQISN